MNVVEKQYPIGSVFEVTHTYNTLKEGTKVILIKYNKNLEFGTFKDFEGNSEILNYPDSSSREVKLISLSTQPATTVNTIDDSIKISTKKKSITIL